MIEKNIGKENKLKLEKKRQRTEIEEIRLKVTERRGGER